MISQIILLGNRAKLAKYAPYLFLELVILTFKLNPTWPNLELN